MNAILILLTVAALALILVSIINANQTRQRLIQQRLSQLKRKLTEMEEIVVAAETFTGSAAIAKLIQDEIVETYKGMLQLSSSSQTLELGLQNALERANSLSEPKYQCRLHRALDSDSKIARAQYILTEAARVVRKRHASEQIELAQMTQFVGELAWAHLMVSAISLTMQGNSAMERGDTLKAYAFYKKAQQVVVESTITDDRRHQLIKELNELLSNKRDTLSTNLMPESNTQTKKLHAKYD